MFHIVQLFWRFSSISIRLNSFMLRTWHEIEGYPTPSREDIRFLPSFAKCALYHPVLLILLLTVFFSFFLSVEPCILYRLLFEPVTSYLPITLRVPAFQPLYLLLYSSYKPEKFKANILPGWYGNWNNSSITLSLESKKPSHAVPFALVGSPTILRA